MKKSIFRTFSLAGAFLSMLIAGNALPAQADTLTVPDFKELMVYGHVNIEWLDSPYPGYVEMDIDTSQIWADWSNGCLMVRPSKEAGEITLKVSSELLKSLSIMDTSAINIPSITGNRKIELNIFANSTLNMGEIEVNSLELNLFSDCLAKVDDIIANRLEISAWKGATADIRNATVGSVDLTAGVSSAIDIAGRCRRRSLQFVNGGKINANGLIEDPGLVISEKELQNHPSKPVKVGVGSTKPVKTGVAVTKP